MPEPCGFSSLRLEHKNSRANTLEFLWLERRDSNPRMAGPEPAALPLGDAPMVYILSYFAGKCYN